MPSRVEDYEVLHSIGTGSYGRCQKIRRKSDGKVRHAARPVGLPALGRASLAYTGEGQGSSPEGPDESHLRREGFEGAGHRGRNAWWQELEAPGHSVSAGSREMCAPPACCFLVPPTFRVGLPT